VKARRATLKPRVTASKIRGCGGCRALAVGNWHRRFDVRVVEATNINAGGRPEVNLATSCV